MMESPRKIPELSERNTRSFWKRVEKLGSDPGCWIWNGATNKDGYGKIIIAGSAFLSHRVSFKIHSGIDPDGLVLHSCHTPCCVNPAHLRQGDDMDNCRDRISARRNAFGERAGMSKVNDVIVRQIRDRAASGFFSDSEIASQYGLSKGAVNAILTNRTWKHVGGFVREVVRSRKLSADVARLIRENDDRPYELAKRFGVTYRTIRHIKMGETWTS